MWSLTANEDEDESATAHFFLGAGDEGLGTCGIGMRTEESDSELLEDEEDEVYFFSVAPRTSNYCWHLCHDQEIQVQANDPNPRATLQI